GLAFADPGERSSLLQHVRREIDGPVLQRAAYAGQFSSARQLTKRAVDAAQRADQNEAAAGYEAEAAVREALAGNTSLAKRGAHTALAHSSGKDVKAIAAIALGYANDSAEAKRIATDLKVRYPKDTIVQSVYLPTIYAAVALGNGKHGDTN